MYACSLPAENRVRALIDERSRILASPPSDNLHKIGHDPRLQTHELHGIAIALLGTHHLADRRGFDEGCGGLRVLIWIVDGEHHVVFVERRGGLSESARVADA